MVHYVIAVWLGLVTHLAQSCLRKPVHFVSLGTQNWKAPLEGPIQAILDSHSRESKNTQLELLQLQL